MQYKDIFVEVRQRVAAFQYWKEFSHLQGLYSPLIAEDEYLDEAYRFLYTSASKGFVEFCAKKEGMGFDEYCDMLDISRENLIG